MLFMKAGGLRRRSFLESVSVFVVVGRLELFTRSTQWVAVFDAFTRRYTAPAVFLDQKCFAALVEHERKHPP